jgi:hypothetical protein
MTNCTAKTDLLIAYQNAANAYAKTVSDLVKGVGIGAPSDYNKLQIAASRERLFAEQARTEFETHILEHGCHIS